VAEGQKKEKKRNAEVKDGIKPETYRVVGPLSLPSSTGKNRACRQLENDDQSSKSTARQETRFIINARNHFKRRVLTSFTI
jgi:hypothetical protein